MWSTKKKKIITDLSNSPLYTYTWIKTRQKIQNTIQELQLSEIHDPCQTQGTDGDRNVWLRVGTVPQILATFCNLISLGAC